MVWSDFHRPPTRGGKLKPCQHESRLLGGARGMPKESDFRLEEIALPLPGAKFWCGAFTVGGPYMRGRLPA